MKGEPAGTSSPALGRVRGLPLGLLPPGTVMADARPAKAAAASATIANCILEIVWDRLMSSGVLRKNCQLAPILYSAIKERR